MKIKTIVITAVLVIGAGAAASFFVRRSHESGIVKVEVVPVTTVNSAAYGMGDMSTISGTIISRDTQVVSLDSNHELKDVYVQQGDRVKKGDKLLEYDMLGDELKEEMEELTKMSLELSLESMKKDLETLKSGRMPESMGGGSSAASSGSDDSDDADTDSDSASTSDDDSDDDDSTKRTHAGVQRQGNGAVGAADTLASKPYALAGANSKPADKLSASTSWGTSDLLYRLQEQLLENIRKNTQGLSGLTAGSLTDEDEEIVPDTSEDSFLTGWDAFLSGEEEPEENTPLTAADLFSTSGSDEDSSDPPDAIPASGGSADDASDLFGDEDTDDPDTAGPQDALFDEEGNNQEGNEPALIAELGETTPAIISSMEDVDNGDGNSNVSSQVEPETLPESDTDTGLFEGPDPNEYVPETDFSGDTFIDDEEVFQDDFDLIARINEFLSTVNNVTLAVDGDWSQIGGWLSTIDEAIDQFRTTFADSDEHETTDLFGDSVIVTAYSVSDNVISQVGDATAKVMQQAYDRLCAYHFIHSVMSLNPEGMPSSAITPEWAVANEQAIRSVVSELASLPQEMWIYNPSTHAFEFRDEYSGMNKAIFSGETMNDFLRNAVLALNSNYVLSEPTEDVPVVSTEGKIWNGNQNTNTDDGDVGGEGYTAEELAEAIKEQEKNIKETELQIREAELGIKEYKKVLDGKIVYANMDGIVKSAGSLENTSGNSFITITGKSGLYVKGSVNELALDTVKIGDTITGTSYETGSSFTAEIVEISEYPDESRNSYYGFGDENTNSSYYPFLAYIDNAEGLEVDSYVDLSLSNTNATASADPMLSGGLSLEEYYIRTDNNGRSYCYVRGEDGLLEKRYLEVGANNWGVITVKSGLTPTDCIAFPYGDGVEEGAQTVEVEYLTAVEGGEY